MKQLIRVIPRLTVVVVALILYWLAKAYLGLDDFSQFADEILFLIALVAALVTLWKTARTSSIELDSSQLDEATRHIHRLAAQSRKTLRSEGIGVARPIDPLCRMTNGREQSIVGTSGDACNWLLRGTDRSVAIVGRSGAGKSTLALQVVVAGTTEDLAQTPVLVDILGWNPKHRILTRFLADRICGSSGARHLVAAVEELLTQGRILPIVDSLDELSPERQRKLADQLRKTEIPRVIVICQPETLDSVLDRPAGWLDKIEIQDLNTHALANLMDDADRGRLWRRITDCLRGERSPMATVLSLPLYANVAFRLAGDGMPPPRDLTCTSSDQETRRLLTAAWLDSHEFLSAASRAGWLHNVHRVMVRCDSSTIQWWHLASLVPWYIRASVTAGIVYTLTLILQFAISIPVKDLPFGLAICAALVVACKGDYPYAVDDSARGAAWRSFIIVGGATLWETLWSSDLTMGSVVFGVALVAIQYPLCVVVCSGVARLLKWMNGTQETALRGHGFTFSFNRLVAAGFLSLFVVEAGIGYDRTPSPPLAVEALGRLALTTHVATAFLITVLAVCYGKPLATGHEFESNRRTFLNNSTFWFSKFFLGSISFTIYLIAWFIGWETTADEWAIAMGPYSFPQVAAALVAVVAIIGLLVGALGLVLSDAGQFLVSLALLSLVRAIPFRFFRFMAQGRVNGVFNASGIGLSWVKWLSALLAALGVRRGVRLLRG